MKFSFFNTNVNPRTMVVKPMKHATLVSFIITLLTAVIGEYFLLIPISYKNPSFYIGLMMVLGLFVFLDTMFAQYYSKLDKIASALAGLLLVFVIGATFFSAEFMHAEKYQKQLTVDETANFYEDNATISFNQIPVVDRDSATRLGDRKMGEIMDYVSQFNVANDYVQINYKGKPVRVTPLNYSGIIKWLNNFREGLPAYILVDMVNQQAEVVRLADKMKYSSSDKFFRNIYRHLFVKYPTLMFDEISFEINDEGIPYFVAPVYEYKIGIFGGKDITGAVLVSAIDGEANYYPIENVPSWLDRVYPEYLVMEQLENYGQYGRGYWNTVFGQKGVLQPTDGYNYITIDDDVYLYTGLTSVMADESNVGFALINLRTKDAKFYNIPGAEEYSAMQSAQGQVQDLHYAATFPILINCGGEPTYFMALKDSASLVKQYAFVSVKNYTCVATGETVAAAQKNYLQTLSNNHHTNVNATLVEKTGVISKIESVVVEGNSRFYFNLVDDEHIYIAPISVSDELPLLEPSDEVSISYIESGDHIIVISDLKK